MLIGIGAIGLYPLKYKSTILSLLPWVPQAVIVHDWEVRLLKTEELENYEG